jgi:cell division septal protein FtsQ
MRRRAARKISAEVRGVSMAAKRKSGTRMKTHYVRSRNRKGNSVAVARRTSSIFVLVLMLLVLLFSIITGFKWINRKFYSENPRFEMQHLVISCDGNLREELIREYTGLSEGMNLFEKSFEEIEDSLKKVPVVESVYLERKLPHTLIVKVKERVPVARVQGRQQRRYPFVLDRDGVVLPHRQSAAALPLIKGIDEDLRLGQEIDTADVDIVLDIIALCEEHGSLRNYIHIESLDVKYDDFIDMRLKHDVRVRMPRFKLKTKLQNLATVIKIAHEEGRRVKEVDLTLDSRKVPVMYY